MNVLVLATDYTDPIKRVAAHFIHSRNVEYRRAGIKVDVLSFRSDRDYELDGVPVYTYRSFRERLRDKRYDILISHAPNLKDHYRFLLRYGSSFPKFVFFFHGHEVLRTSKVYPAPYSYVQQDSVFSKMMREAYDIIKLKILGKYFLRIKDKAEFVFVSEWMARMFYRFLEIDPTTFKGQQHIIHNCIGSTFQENRYDISASKNYDFITIRNMLDKSKYAIDIVHKIAQSNPKYKFCLIGKGIFFEHNSVPENLIWIDRHLTHDEVIGQLNQSHCALMPTRTDAQGVMACEMASFGIPLITSNIEVCKEIFEGFNNVAFLDNNAYEFDLGEIYERLVNASIEWPRNDRYYLENTVGKEIVLFNKIME